MELLAKLPQLDPAYPPNGVDKGGADRTGASQCPGTLFSIIHKRNTANLCVSLIFLSRA